MQSFLAQVIEEIYNKHQGDLNNVVLVLPSKRAGSFLKHELKKLIKQTSFAPTTYAIQEFIQEISSLKLISGLQLIFEFYEAYKNIHKDEETEDLQTFSSWAQTAIQDFNEIDRYLIEPDKIFDHLYHIKELDQFHWTTEKDQTEFQVNYLKFWNILKLYYHGLNKRLTQKGLGYQGMIYREATEQLEYYLQANTHKTHYFIGFNALNNAESHIIQEILATTDSEAFWDTDETFLNDFEHDAGLFLREIKNNWKYFKSNPFKYTSNSFTQPKNIEIIGIPGNISQAKYIGTLIKTLESTRQDLNSTAIVLGNESLLPPVLNAIPDTVKALNITSGYPLEHTPFASFFETLLEVWTNNTNGSWYFRDIVSLLSDPITHRAFEHDDTINNLLNRLNKENIIYAEENDIYNIASTEAETAILKKLFLPSRERDMPVIINTCIEWTLFLKEKFHSGEQRNTVFLEYLFRFYELFTQLSNFNETYKSITQLKTLRNLYRELLLKQTVDFKGEPLEGLQLMGMLESRNLDFETVIISSVNEGILPAGKSNSSFIPFDIKTAYELPTYKEKDAVYTYHFYRLLQKAKNIYLLYNTEADSLDGGEKSRFLQQLVINPQPLHQIKEKIGFPKIKADPILYGSVEKNDLLLKRIQEVAAKGFSPSSLSNYVRNPLDFYKQSILGIKEADTVEETVAANTLGTIVHDSLEFMYKPLTGQYLTQLHLDAMHKQLDQVITAKYREVYTNPDSLKGKNLISFHICKRYVENFLKYETERLKKGDKIKIIHIESNLNIPLNIPELDFPVVLKGKVDRVEEHNGTIRIIDYKTGRTSQTDLEIINYEDMISDYKYSKAFQVLCYAYMMQKSLGTSNLTEGGIISFKNLKGGFLKFAKKEKPRDPNKQFAIDYEVLTAYENELFNLIREICNPETAFIEKEIETHDY